MNTQTIYNIQTKQPSAVAISGDFSGVSVYATNELVEALGGIESAFHEIKRLQNRNMLPRMGSVGKPLTVRDLQLARENERMGHRHWQWKSITRNKWNYWGYGYMDENEFVFILSDGSEFQRVEM